MLCPGPKSQLKLSFRFNIIVHDLMFKILSFCQLATNNYSSHIKQFGKCFLILHKKGHKRWYSETKSKALFYIHHLFIQTFYTSSKIFLSLNINENKQPTTALEITITTSFSYTLYILFYFFSVRLLSVLCGQSVFSSPPQRPMTSDFEAFLYQILSITFIFLS